jgi:putative endonuclease
MFTVYVLQSRTTGKLYTGQTEDLQRRFHEHQTGIAHYTRGRGPWEIKLTGKYDSRRKAMQRERFLKSGKGREWLQKILEIRASPPQTD